MREKRPPAERSLHDLYAEYDKLWNQFTALSHNDRQAASQADYQDNSEASRLYLLMRNIMAAIRPLERNFETDLAACLGETMKADKHLSAEVYAALCNVEWEHEGGSRSAYSWRAAAGLIAELRTGIDGDEDYLTWYCTGNEGHVSARVAHALATRGWKRRTPTSKPS